jgi:hypothetical protein
VSFSEDCVRFGDRLRGLVEAGVAVKDAAPFLDGLDIMTPSYTGYPCLPTTTPHQAANPLGRRSEDYAAGLK